MNEPYALYSPAKLNFSKEISLPQNVVLSLGVRALQRVLHKIDVIELLLKNASLSNAVISSELPHEISELCFQIGAASSALCDFSDQRKKESRVIYEGRISRCLLFKRIIGDRGIILKHFSNRKLRNSLVHVDEWIQEEMIKKPKVAWFVDVGLDLKGFQLVEGIDYRFCRCLDIPTKSIIHFDFNLPLVELRDEARQADAAFSEEFFKP